MNMRLIKALYIFVYLFLVTGCGMHDSIVEEMDSAHLIADKKKSSTFLERDSAVTAVVEKFFPIGMNKQDVLLKLKELKDDGFEVTEIQQLGTRDWPDGKFIYYENVNREKEYSPGTVGYIAEKKYDSLRLLLSGRWYINKVAVISIKLNSRDALVKAEGRININGI